MTDAEKQAILNKYPDYDKDSDKTNFYKSGKQCAYDSYRKMSDIAHEYGVAYGSDAELDYTAGFADGINQFAILYPNRISDEQALNEVQSTFKH